MIRRITGAVLGAALIASLGASAAFAGEVTGNGRSLQLPDGGKWGTFLHARSFCAYSGQEDLQYQDEQGNPLETIQKGDPARAQSWGQIPKEFRPAGSAAVFGPGVSCNPTKASGEPE